MPSLIEAKARVFDRDDRPGGPPVPPGLKPVKGTGVIKGYRIVNEVAERALDTVCAGWGDKRQQDGWQELSSYGDPVALVSPETVIVFGRTPENFQEHRNTIFTLVNKAQKD